LRASLSYTRSDIERAAFYPNDAQLQAAAATSTLPSGFDAPYYESDSGSGTSLSAYAAVEKHVSPHLVIGAKLDIDRADYYEPTILMLYVRHAFGRATTLLAIPPRPVRGYNE
jgi:cellulose synthase operon protein C